MDEALARPRETAAPRGLLYGKGSSSLLSEEERESDRCSRSDMGGRNDGTFLPWRPFVPTGLFLGERLPPPPSRLFWSFSARSMASEVFWSGSLRCAEACKWSQMVTHGHK